MNKLYVIKDKKSGKYADNYLKGEHYIQPYFGKYYPPIILNEDVMRFYYSNTKVAKNECELIEIELLEIQDTDLYVLKNNENQYATNRIFYKYEDIEIVNFDYEQNEAPLLFNQYLIDFYSPFMKVDDNGKYVNVGIREV